MFASAWARCDASSGAERRMITSPACTRDPRSTFIDPEIPSPSDRCPPSQTEYLRRQRHGVEWLRFDCNHLLCPEVDVSLLRADRRSQPATTELKTNDSSFIAQPPANPRNQDHQDQVLVKPRMRAAARSQRLWAIPGAWPRSQPEVRQSPPGPAARPLRSRAQERAPSESCQ